LDHVRARQLQLVMELGGQTDGPEWTGRVRRVHEAERPVAAFRDRRRVYAVVGGLSGFFLGFLLIALYGAFRAQMRHVEDIEGVVPNAEDDRFLAIIPDAACRVPSSDTLTAIELTEYCVHHLRTLIQLGSDADQRTIALTSASACAGKTTLGIAIGLSFGASGSRTLVVDCDLVGHGLSSTLPSLVCAGTMATLEACDSFETLDEAAAHVAARTAVRRAFHSRDVRVSDAEIESLLARVQDASGTGSSRAAGAVRALETMARHRGVNGYAPGRRMGILDVLGGTSLEDCVLETGFDNLSVLTVGDARAVDAERLSHKQLRKLITACHEHFDTVILDTGPALGSLEATFVAAAADEVVFIVARGTSRKLARDALKRLDRIGAKVSGVVFNRAEGDDVLGSYSYASRSQGEPMNGEQVEAKTT